MTKAGDTVAGRIPGSHLVPQDTLAQVLPKLSKMGSEVGGDILGPEGGALLSPRTGLPMRVERLACPRGSVVVFKNKSAHAVEPKPVDSVTTRWNFGTVITNRLQAKMLFVCVFTSMSAGVEERRPHEPPRLDDASLGAEAGARQRRAAWMLSFQFVA